MALKVMDRLGLSTAVPISLMMACVFALLAALNAQMANFISTKSVLYSLTGNISVPEAHEIGGNLRKSWMLILLVFAYVAKQVFGNDDAAQPGLGESS
ncbi:hypothetical protein [Arenibacterium sp. CAU 1754]